MYMGSTISSNPSVDSELNRRNGEAAATMARVAMRVLGNPMLTINAKIQVYPACVLSTLLYGNESWTVYSRQERWLNTFHLRNLRRIPGITWQDRVLNMNVSNQAGILSMFLHP